MERSALLARLAEHGGSDALVWRDRATSYADLVRLAEERGAALAAAGVGPGSVVALEADFSPEAVAGFLALHALGAVLVPLAAGAVATRARFLELAQVELVARVDGDDRAALERTGARADHPLYAELARRGHPGLVLFSSGSTGESKAALHDLAPLVAKFDERRRALRTISFLLFDHIGGVNTMLHTLANGGCLVVPADRRPETVLAAIERHRVECLPTSPTFLNLVLLTEAWRGRDLASLELVTYGTEPMLASTLARLHALLPRVRLQQTYGLSEVGILRSKSRGSDSLWVKVGGAGFETRVVDGLLEVRARSAMLGYLNAPSPFTADGWLPTGDAVEVDGEWLRILGRRSEIVNVGGEKVWPAEVESVVQELPEVAEVTVHGEPNPIVGQIVCARVRPRDAGADPAELAARVKRHCAERLARYKVPVKVSVATGAQHGERFKKLRRASGDASGGEEGGG